MRTIAVGSSNVMQRIRRMLAGMAEKQRTINETRYQPPQIWRRGMRLQANLRYARPARHLGQDDGRPKGMTGRQWKRLQKAEHALTMRSSAEKFKNTTRRTISLDEARRRIHAAHASCDRPSPGHPFRGSRRLRTLIE